jgi:hypothetical protein
MALLLFIRPFPARKAVSVEDVRRTQWQVEGFEVEQQNFDLKKEHEP